MMTHNNKPVDFVSLVIPTLNEALHIERVINEVRPQCFDFEILVVDGGSEDDTIDIVNKLGDARIRVIHNPERIQSAGVNLAISESDPRSRYFIRVDAHCSYPAGWSDLIVRHLIDTGATSVVVPMHTLPDNVVDTIQAAIAYSQNSRLGNGGSVHRGKQFVSRYVEHGHHAGFIKDFFILNGGYDTSFAANEDAEYDQRTARNHAKVWLSSDAEIIYFPRKTMTKLSSQYFRYGAGRCATVLKHRAMPKFRQMIPIFIALSAISAVFLWTFNPIFLLPFLAYLLFVLVFAFTSDGTSKFSLQVFLALVVMHLSWGFGFIFHAAKTSLQRLLRHET